MENVFKKRLTALLDKHGVLQSDVARGIDVNQATVSRWLNQDAPAKPGSKRRLALFFDVPVDYFDEEDDSAAEAMMTGSMVSTPRLMLDKVSIKEEIATPDLVAKMIPDPRPNEPIDIYNVLLFKPCTVKGIKLDFKQRIELLQAIDKIVLPESFNMSSNIKEE